MKFTVITVTYNSAKFVRQCIQSVLAQSFKDFEYIISDDHSTDNTWEIIQTYKDPRIRTKRNDQNIGEYQNRNKTLYEAIGEFVIWIDGDDMIYKHALRDYAEFITAFPQADAIWGVHSYTFDFIVFPYLFFPDELTRINYLSTIPVTSVGFTDSVFKTEKLKEMEGFSMSYAIGDTFIKRKFACKYPVLLVPAGRAFWRRVPGQASERAEIGLKNFQDMMAMDEEILNSDYFPIDGKDHRQCLENYYIRRAKLLFKHTVAKGKVALFIKMFKKLNIPWRHIFYLLKKGKYDYKPATSVEPLYNDFNFPQ